MEDIEDMFKNESAEAQQISAARIKNKVMRSAKRSKAAAKKAEAQGVEEPVAEAKVSEVAEPPAESAKADGDVVPGKAKVFVKTYGCSHNISDSEYMAGLL